MDKEKMLIEEIKIVQDIIKRMASNSFLIKGWTITIVFAVLFVRFDKSNSWANIFLTLFPLILFWYLDAYYLQQEKLFREVHKWIRNNRLESEEYLFDYDTTRFYCNVGSVGGVMFSETLLWFYGLTFFAILLTGISLYLLNL